MKQITSPNFDSIFKECMHFYETPCIVALFQPILIPFILEVNTHAYIYIYSHTYLWFDIIYDSRDSENIIYVNSKRRHYGFRRII